MPRSSPVTGRVCGAWAGCRKPSGEHGRRSVMGTSKARAEQRQEAKVASKGHMIVSNGVIFSSREPLQRLMAKSLPVRTSFALARLANTLNGHFQTIESVRNGLIKKYGRPVEGKHDGTMQVAADAEDYLVFIAEMNELF